MSKDGKIQIWDDYWRFDRLCSFDIPVGSAQWIALQRHWAAFQTRLFGGAKVLDIGCGNGAASFAFVRAAQARGVPVEVHAIDHAAIDPAAYCPEHADYLSHIHFKARVGMEALPFEDSTFDAVISQFGIEYGNLEQSTAEAARVLKNGGLLSALVLPTQSKIAQAAQRGLRQARQLLQDPVLFQEASRIIREYHQGGEDRDQVTRSNLDVFASRVAEMAMRYQADEFDVVSAVVTRLNDVFLKRQTGSLESQLADIEEFRSRFAHYAARTQATVKATVGDSRYELLKNTFKKYGLTVVDTRSVFAGTEGLIASQVTAQVAKLASVPEPQPPLQ